MLIFSEVVDVLNKLDTDPDVLYVACKAIIKESPREKTLLNTKDITNEVLDRYLTRAPLLDLIASFFALLVYALEQIENPNIKERVMHAILSELVNILPREL